MKIANRLREATKQTRIAIEETNQPDVLQHLEQALESLEQGLKSLGEGNED